MNEEIVAENILVKRGTLRIRSIDQQWESRPEKNKNRNVGIGGGCCGSNGWLKYEMEYPGV
jgi:hypothetical protein